MVSATSATIPWRLYLHRKMLHTGLPAAPNPKIINVFFLMSSKKLERNVVDIPALLSLLDVFCAIREKRQWGAHNLTEMRPGQGLCGCASGETLFANNDDDARGT